MFLSLHQPVTKSQMTKKLAQKFRIWFLVTNDTLYLDNGLPTVHYGNTGCGVFKWGVQYQKDFCIRINIPKENY